MPKDVHRCFILIWGTEKCIIRLIILKLSFRVYCCNEFQSIFPYFIRFSKCFTSLHFLSSDSFFFLKYMFLFLISNSSETAFYVDFLLLFSPVLMPFSILDRTAKTSLSSSFLILMIEMFLDDTSEIKRVYREISAWLPVCLPKTFLAAIISAWHEVLCGKDPHVCGQPSSSLIFHVCPGPNSADTDNSHCRQSYSWLCISWAST